MTSPAKRLKASVPVVPAPMPLALNLTPVPAETEPETFLPTTPLPGFAIQTDGQMVDYPATDVSLGDSSPEAPSMIDGILSQLATAMDPANDPALAAINTLVESVQKLTEAVNSIGLQQQWMVEQVGQMKGPFDQLLAGSGGNPLKMFSALLSGKGMRSNG